MSQVDFTSLLLSAGEHSNPLIPEINELIWGTICFVALFAIVGPKVFPKIDQMLKQRSEEIEGKLVGAEKTKQEAEKLLAESRQHLIDARSESSRIMDQARSNADKLEEQLRRQAEDQVNRIVERGNEVVLAERARVSDELKSEVGLLVVDLTEKITKESLDREAHLRLVDNYIEELAAMKR